MSLQSESLARYFTSRLRLDKPRFLSSTPLDPRIKLRGYQEECISKIISSLATIRKPTVSLPTGSGKTVIFTSLIPLIKPQLGQGTKTLILVNRVEIAKQTVMTLQNLMPDLKVGVEMGKQTYKSNPDVDVCVASIHTIHKPDRLAAFDPSEFKLVIVDEAHHTAARTYLDTLGHFGIHEDEPKVYCIGVSATFFRKDKKSLEIFDKIVYHREATEMIDEGHLSKVQVCKYDFDIPDGFTTQKNPTNFLFSTTGLEFIVKLWKANRERYRSTVVFCINKKHVGLLVAQFRQGGIDARGLTSEDKAENRNTIVNAFKSQEFPVLVNCSILSEGTDIPCIDQIMFATTLGSPGLAMQMIGRGLRQFPGKEVCNTVFLSPMVKFDTNTGLLPELRGYALVDELETRVDATGEETGSGETRAHYEPYGELDSAIESIQEEKTSNLMEIFKSNGKTPSSPPRLAWVRYNGSYFLNTPQSHIRLLKIDYKAKQYTLKTVRSYPRAKEYSRGYIQDDILSSADLDEVRLAAENLISERYRASLLGGYFNPGAKWRQGKPTAGQLDLLKKFGLDQVLPHINKGQATTLLCIKVAGGFKLTDEKVNSSMRLGLDTVTQVKHPQGGVLSSMAGP